jgi:hypothetical protein
MNAPRIVWWLAVFILAIIAVLLFRQHVVIH